MEPVNLESFELPKGKKTTLDRMIPLATMTIIAGLIVVGLQLAYWLSTEEETGLKFGLLITSAALSLLLSLASLLLAVDKVEEKLGQKFAKVLCLFSAHLPSPSRG